MDNNLNEIRRKIKFLRAEMLGAEDNIRKQVNRAEDCSEAAMHLMAMRVAMLGLAASIAIGTLLTAVAGVHESVAQNRPSRIVRGQGQCDVLDDKSRILRDIIGIGDKASRDSATRTRMAWQNHSKQKCLAPLRPRGRSRIKRLAEPQREEKRRHRERDG